MKNGGMNEIFWAYSKHSIFSGKIWQIIELKSVGINFQYPMTKYVDTNFSHHHMKVLTSSHEGTYLYIKHDSNLSLRHIKCGIVIIVL